MDEILECQHCYQGYMLEPQDKHSSYLECDACGAMELTYSPMPYQEVIHTVPYTSFINKHGVEEIEPQIIFVAGGLKIPCPL